MKYRRREDSLQSIGFKHVPQWRYCMALGILFGLLLSFRNEMQSLMEQTQADSTTSQWYQTANERLSRPFKVPGPESICPAIASDDTKQIHFIESSGNKCLTPRQACGVESAARQNPQMNVTIYVNVAQSGPPAWDDLMMRPGRVRSCAFNQMLNSQFSNVEFVRRNFTSMLQESVFRSIVDSFHESQWSVVQTSDAVRVLILKKHGGFYLDFDNIVFRPIHCLRNVLSYLEPNIENGVMVLDAEHPFLKFLMRYLVQTYEPNNRISLGPSALRKAFQLFCQTGEDFKSGLYKCHNNSTLTLIHPDAFFPIKHHQNSYFYSKSLEGYDIQTMERAYLTHVYLSSWGTKVHHKSLYARLARQYCPTTWSLTSTENIPLGF